MKMKKSTPVIIALALMMVLASCKTPSENPASSSGNKPEGSDSVVTTVPGGDSTTTPLLPSPIIFSLRSPRVTSAIFSATRANGKAREASGIRL